MAYSTNWPITVRSAVPEIISSRLLRVRCAYRQSNDDSDEDSINEMLKVLLRKLDKDVDDAELASVEEPRAYNVSRVQHGDTNENAPEVVVRNVITNVGGTGLTN